MSQSYQNNIDWGLTKQEDYEVAADSVCYYIGIKDKNGVPQKANAGVAVIAKATNAQVLPVAICCDGPIKRGKKLTVSYGKPITCEEMGFDKEEFTPHDIKNAANLVMDRITQLWEAEVH